MPKTSAVIFLFDVDNTLLDNDSVQSYLKDHLADAYGVSARDRYWDILEALRSELGYVDYLGALERFRVEELHRPDVLRMSNWLVDYPFADRLYPGALGVLNMYSNGGRWSFFQMAMPCSSRARWSGPACGGQSMIVCSSTFTRNASLNT